MPRTARHTGTAACAACLSRPVAGSGTRSQRRRRRRGRCAGIRLGQRQFQTTAWMTFLASSLWPATIRPSSLTAAAMSPFVRSCGSISGRLTNPASVSSASRRSVNSPAIQPCPLPAYVRERAGREVDELVGRQVQPGRDPDLGAMPRPSGWPSR